MVAIDEFLDLDEFFGVEEWPPGRTQAGPQVLQISWSPCADDQILIYMSGLRVWEGRTACRRLARCVMTERRSKSVGLDQQWCGARLPLILTVPGS